METRRRFGLLGTRRACAKQYPMHNRLRGSKPTLSRRLEGSSETSCSFSGKHAIDAEVAQMQSRPRQSLQRVSWVIRYRGWSKYKSGHDSYSFLYTKLLEI